MESRKKHSFLLLLITTQSFNMKKGDTVILYDKYECIVAYVDGDNAIVEVPDDYRAGWGQRHDSNLDDYQPKLSKRFWYTSSAELKSEMEPKNNYSIF